MKENRELVKKILAQLSECPTSKTHVAAKIGESLLTVAEDLDEENSPTQRIFTQMKGVDRSFMLGLTAGLAFAVANENVASQIREAHKEIAKERGEKYAN